jgi:hypothetical protein
MRHHNDLHTAFYLAGKAAEDMQYVMDLDPKPTECYMMVPRQYPWLEDAPRTVFSNLLERDICV